MYIIKAATSLITITNTNIQNTLNLLFDNNSDFDNKKLKSNDKLNFESINNSIIYKLYEIVYKATNKQWFK
jgi:hypothetical protein